MRSFLKYWLPVLVWLSLIFVGSTEALSVEQTSRFLIPFLRWLDPQISSATIATIHFAVRKAGHLAEYAILAILLWRALRRGTNLRATMSTLFIAAWLMCCVFAVSDEFHQSFVTSRTASLHDVFVDIIGATIGLAPYLILSRRRFVKNR
jgi:VanZ family protein